MEDELIHLKLIESIQDTSQKRKIYRSSQISNRNLEVSIECSQQVELFKVLNQDIFIKMPTIQPVRGQLQKLW